MNNEVFDLLVIGGGPGGYVCALKAAQLGVGKVACVEKRTRLGGTCLNEGCIPSKALLESSHHYHRVLHDVAKHGVICSDVKFDMKVMMQQKDSAVASLGTGIDGLLKKNKITRLMGSASFIDKNTVAVSDGQTSQTVRARNIVIATGSQTSALPSIKIDGKIVITSTEALMLTEPPKRLLVIGAGAIGLELGSVWSRLGSKVTIVEFMPIIAPTCDKEISAKLQDCLKKQGMEFMLGTQVINVSINGNSAKVEFNDASVNSSTHGEFDRVIVSVGRKPYTEGLALDKIGLKVDERGRIPVNDKLMTNVDNIYAIGDVIPGPMLAHKAEEDGVAVAEILVGKHGHINYNTVPAVIYTCPEVAMVGKTEEQLKSEGVAYKVGKFSFVANSRAGATLVKDGLAKVLADAKTDEVLGVHIMHEIAGELIVPAVLGMNYRASSEDLAMTCCPHPGYSEALKEACMATFFKAIHS